MDRVNLGLMGLGRWAREAYVPILKETPTARVVAVAAKTDATRRLAREEFGPSLAVYDDFRDLLGDASVQAVAVALPNELHAEAITAAAAAGRHVFFEPPIGLTHQDIRRTLQALSTTDRVVQADHELRYLPVMDLVRERIVSGIIGDPLMAKVRLWCDWGHGGGEWAETAGRQGFFLWLGCWYLDLLDCVFETAPERVSVVGGRAMNGCLLDHGWATMEYPEGRIGGFEFSLIAVGGTQISLHVAGTAGEIEADLLTGVCRWRRKGDAWQEAARSCAEPACGFAGMRESMVDFMSAVRGERPAKANILVSRRVHEAALACARSEAERQTVSVEALGDR